MVENQRYQYRFPHLDNAIFQPIQIKHICKYFMDTEEPKS